MLGPDLSLTSLSVLSDKGGGTAIFFNPNGPLRVDASPGTVVGYFYSRNGMNFTYTLTDDQNSNLEIIGNEIRVAGDLSIGTYTLAITVSNEDGWSQTVTQEIVVEAVIQDIVAWGDSLTESSGASSNAARYPAVAATLFNPDRNIVNRGIGGQTSTQIAARQGGVPIEITVSGDQVGGFNETLLYDWDFTGTQLHNWVAVNGSATVTATEDGMRIENIGNDSGARITTGINLPAGRYKTVITSRDVETVSRLRVQSRTPANATAGNDIGSTVDGIMYGVGTTSAAGSRVNIIGSVNENGSGSIVIQRVQIYAIDAAYATAVTAKSVNILTNAGTFAGWSQGTVGGVAGYISTDSSGNWTFNRTAAGGTAAIPAGSAFVPDEAEILKARTAWIWAGRNNAGAVATIKADIAAMIAHLDHSRYLVGAILTSSADNAGSIAIIQALNTDLATIYADRFVNLYAILRSHGDGSANDIADIAAGYIPRTLRVDAVHLNDAGYAIVAQAMADATLARGW